MLYGVMAGDSVLLVADASQGRPVTESAAPAAPEGYEARARFEDAGTSIAQVWDLVPKAGTPAEAALALARMQAAQLSDEQALSVPALYDAWAPATSYGAGVRLTYNGVLYKVLQAHLSAANARPGEAPSLYARVLAGQSGSVGEWEQPDSTNPYSKGDRVTHDGKTWESLVDNNVWEPGATGTGALWREVSE